MANTKISNLTALGAAPATDDVLVVVDTSAAQTKKMTVANLIGAMVANANAFTADQTIGDATTTKALFINGPAGAARSIGFQTAGSSRWFLQADAIAESGANAGSDLRILARTDAGGSLATAMVIERATGNVLVGYTASNGAYKLQVNSQIYATNATVATSDARVKTNVAEVFDGLAIIEQLRPVTFDFIEHEVHEFSRERQIGFLAQDVESVLVGAEYVRCVVPPTETEDQIKGLADTKLIPLLVRSVQELSARVQGLEAAMIDMALGGG